MSQTTLPPEINDLIIGVLGDEVVTAFKLRLVVQRDVQAALAACALVCKQWHSFTLPHTFYGVRLRHDPLSRRHFASLTELVKANPYIKECIRQFNVLLPGPGTLDAERLGDICRTVSPVETLTLYNGIITPPHDLSQPSILDSLRPILITPHLRDLTLCSKSLPTHLLEVLHSIRSLTLRGIQEIVVDHGPKDRDEKAWRSSALKKLDLHPAEFILSRIGAAAESDSDLAAFFENVKLLVLWFRTADLGHDSRLWYTILARWRYLEKLDINWTVRGESVSQFVSGCMSNTVCI